MTRESIDQVLDPGWQEQDATLRSRNPLGFSSYAPEHESVITGSGTCGAFPVETISFDFDAFGGSMGIVAGEKIARCFERACARRAAVIALCASGGARMQEGMLSLSQMTKTVGARSSLERAGLPFIAYLRNPTTGGVYASFASLADVVLAEPHATIGFAGPRVAQAMTGAPLPEGSHTAEFAMQAGLIDGIVSHVKLRTALETALDLLAGSDAPAHALLPPEPEQHGDAWSHVEAARSPERPATTQLLRDIASELLNIGGASGGISCALARIGGRRTIAILMERARPTPLGYRKARRAISLASRLSIPIVALIDTPGADPSSESEANGIAREIASTFDAMLSARVPTVAVVTGEGGSGGALALASTDRLLICENAFFSVIAPEGAASILKRDDVRQVAAELRLTSFDLKRLGIADAVIAESGDLAASVAAATAWALSDIDPAKALESRRARWREAGNEWLDE